MKRTILAILVLVMVAACQHTGSGYNWGAVSGLGNQVQNVGLAEMVSKRRYDADTAAASSLALQGRQNYPNVWPGGYQWSGGTRYGTAGNSRGWSY